MQVKRLRPVGIGAFKVTLTPSSKACDVGAIAEPEAKHIRLRSCQPLGKLNDSDAVEDVVTAEDGNTDETGMGNASTLFRNDAPATDSHWA